MAKGKGRSGDYEVGYGKPPKEYRFAPGQSGNPKGRKKGSRGLKADLQAELDGTIAISINGERVKGTRQRLFVKALATRAAFGDLKAASILAPLILQVLGIEDRGGGRQKLSDGDQAILDALLADDSETAEVSAGSESADPPIDPNEDETRPLGGGEVTSSKLRTDDGDDDVA